MSYNSIPEPAAIVTSVSTGLATFAANAPTARSMFSPGRMYSVVPRARSVSWSRR